MSLLAQIPSAPKRPRDAPGSDGYVLYRRPGFANEQRCYRIVVQTKSTTINEETATRRVHIDFPDIKLGSGMYVLDLDRLDIMYTGTNLQNNITFRTTHACVVLGYGETLHVDAAGKTSREPEHNFLLFGSNTYNVTTDNTKRLITYNSGAGRRPSAVDDHAAVIQNDMLVLTFEIQDFGSTFFRATAAGTTNVIESWTRDYHFVVRPNPARMNAYFED